MSAALLIVALAASPTAAGPAWISTELTHPGSVQVEAVEAFLNTECQPAGLDGIQLLAVQRGHDDAMHLHVYCRQDRRANVRYRVTMPGAPKGKALGLIAPLLANPNVRIGPFHFGEAGGDDGFLLVEKLG